MSVKNIDEQFTHTRSLMLKLEEAVNSAEFPEGVYMHNIQPN